MRKLRPTKEIMIKIERTGTASIIEEEKDSVSSWEDEAVSQDQDLPISSLNSELNSHRIPDAISFLLVVQDAYTFHKIFDMHEKAEEDP